MGQLNVINIEGYKSIGNPIQIRFPQNMPVVLIGENNSGKTNILRAIDLMFGEWWPKSKDFEDHDFWGRCNQKNRIIIKTEVSEFEGRLGRSMEYECGGFRLTAEKGKSNEFVAIQSEDGNDNIYVNSALRNEISSVFVSPEHNLSYQLSYSSKYTLLSKVTKAFHDRLVSNEERIKHLKDLFDQTVATFLEVDEFKEFKDNLTNIAGEMIGNMSHGLQLDFSAYDPSNYLKTLRVHPSQNGEIRAFEELGTGQAQILALSFAHAYAKCFKQQGLILLIDEPESHLHPLAQKWLAKVMFKMAAAGLQVVISTHSPYFIDLEFLEGLYLVKKVQEETVLVSTNKKQLSEFCISKGANTAKTKKETIIPFYSGNVTTNILKGFFSNKIILVEGPTEELALPIYLEKAGFDTLKEGVDVIGVGGKGNLAKWKRFFNIFEIPVYICFDNDANDDGEAVKRKDALKTVGINEEDMNSYINQEVWEVCDEFCVFGKDFEVSLRKEFNDYSDLEKEAIQELGDSKPIVARAVSKRLEYRSDESGWKKITQMIGKISELKTVGVA
ncbi:MAG: ATP-dependent nuclease [Bacteriovoracia bacterium]